MLQRNTGSLVGGRTNPVRGMTREARGILLM